MRSATNPQPVRFTRNAVSCATTLTHWFDGFRGVRAAERKGGFVGEVEGVVHFPGSSHGAAPHDKGRQLSARWGAARILSSRVPTAAAEKPKVQLAEWRKRVHAARRRVMLLIITMLRLRKGHKHPVRLPRLDDMSFFIPVQLSGDKASFIKELLKYVVTQQQVGRVAAVTDPHEHQGGTPLPPAQLLCMTSANCCFAWISRLKFSRLRWRHARLPHCCQPLVQRYWEHW